ncbi:hypothetical protein [Streptomyces sp. NBC_00091]|uniref:hypothetical protein n=1 Tax=Streptomyces sp. NBC_00091 TaxID=2975648 RepID=UPI00225A17F7|nr:hypothetical protein [Streptomyces sp. NBC_00091]MCX5379506.1 hypothetical protein [Streptomyces sp. NBC_00091]
MKIQIPLPADPHTSTVYTDWARAHDPGAEPAAVALFDEVCGTIHRAYEKPGRFVDGLERRVRELEPAHLPWFWDTVGHKLIGWHLRSAARAYALARKAERTHRLPVDPDWHRANVLLFARAGALPATELSGHQAWLATALEPGPAHEEYVRVLHAWAASPGELPADLARRVRLSARAAGLDTAEEARVLGLVLGAARGKEVPDRLLDAAAPLLAAHPPAQEVAALLLDLFPESRGDASSWLRLLLGCGAADAAAAGRIVPEGGLTEWFSRYAGRYAHGRHGGGVMRQPMPAELFGLLALFAPRLRACEAPLRLHEDRYRYRGLDADLLDACLAEGIAVADPGVAVGLVFWDGRSRRDLKALAADPVFGPRLEGTVHSALRGGGTAISRLPRNAGITAEVHGRVESLLAALRGGGLAAADEAVDELRTLLDRPTARALDGIDEALAEPDLTGPLGRALRAGLPEEYGWPALEDAVAGLGGPAEVTGVTCTWPLLTVYGPDRAVTVDHAGPRASCAFRLPEGAGGHTVHYVGGQFLVAWTDRSNGSFGELAFWSDRPDEVFEPEQKLGLRRYGGMIQGGLGYHFETPDGGGRHEGGFVLRPGGREGVGSYDFQMTDGRHHWSTGGLGSREVLTRVDPHTGRAGTDTTPPEFHTLTGLPPGTERFEYSCQTLAALPADAPASPLGQDGRLTGFRVLNRTPYKGPSPTEFTLEGVDGRRATYRSRRLGRKPWAVIRMPQGGEEAVLVGQEAVRCHAAEDNSLLWQVHGFPGSDRRRTPGFGEGAGPVPPPAFWHFLTPRCETSSKALRAVDDTAVRALLEAAVGGDPAPALPGRLEPRIADGVDRAARLAADVLRRLRELARRVAVMRAAPVVSLRTEVTDSVLAPALYHLVPYRHRRYDEPALAPQPALLTAVAADGRHLRGEIGDEARVLARPAAPETWEPLVGGIGAVAWRAAVATTPDEERTALAALLETWSGQPFAEAGGSWRTGRAREDALAACRAAGHTLASGAVRDGLARFLQRAADPAPEGAEDCVTSTVEEDDAVRLPRLLELLAERGPLAVAPAAREAFARLTGVRGPVAALILAGFPGRDNHREHLKLLASAPFKANKTLAEEYGELSRRLGDAGRRAVLAAGLPQDVAELWEPDGTIRAAERMAAVWTGLLGAEEYVDEELAAALEADLGLPLPWARALPAGRAPAEAPFGEDGLVLAGTRTGGIHLHHAGPDGAAGDWVDSRWPAHHQAASVIAWALTERPVGDPAARGALGLYGRLRAQLDGPGALVPLGGFFEELAGVAETDPAFTPYEGTVLPCPQPLWEGAAGTSTVHDDGLFVVAVPSGDSFLRPAAFADPERMERAERVAATVREGYLLTVLRRHRDLLDGLARLAARAADTPVPEGGYEANPALSAPELVAEVAEALGVGADAAALYLQLLALARPTDRSVRRWNGWTAARHKAAQAQLLASGAVESDKRARAGRTLFLPDQWTELKAPHLPVEHAKLAAHLASASGTTLHAPLLRLLAPLPPHELFARAWAATGR